MQDLLLDLEEVEFRLATMRFRGVRGTTGTQASFMDLFDGDGARVERLNRRVAEKMGFDKVYGVTGQTYTRKTDAACLATLSGIAESASKFANDVRLLSHLKEVEEPYEENQIGSSAMPYKRNPMRCERINALARHVIVLSLDPAFTAASQWFERTLDDSANKRIAVPEAYLATDSVLLLMHNVAGGMVVYPEMIRRRLMEELPFMATENLMMRASKRGGDRQDLHERVRRTPWSGPAHQGRGLSNDLMDRIAADDAFGVTRQELEEDLRPELYVGRAPGQVDDFLAEWVEPVLARYPRRRAGGAGAAGVGARRASPPRPPPPILPGEGEVDALERGCARSAPLPACGGRGRVGEPAAAQMPPATPSQVPSPSAVLGEGGSCKLPHACQGSLQLPPSPRTALGEGTWGLGRRRASEPRRVPHPRPLPPHAGRGALRAHPAPMHHLPPPPAVSGEGAGGEALRAPTPAAPAPPRPSPRVAASTGSPTRQESSTCSGARPTYSSGRRSSSSSWRHAERVVGGDAVHQVVGRPVCLDLAPASMECRRTRSCRSCRSPPRLDGAHHQVLGRHEGELLHQAPADHLRVHHHPDRHVVHQQEHRVRREVRLGNGDALVGRVVQRALEPLRGRRERRVHARR
jgi:hypothetical protein